MELEISNSLVLISKFFFFYVPGDDITPKVPGLQSAKRRKAQPNEIPERSGE